MKRPKNRTVFVVVAITAIIAYTVTALVLTAQDHIVPDSLTVAFFAAWTSELALLAGIKIFDKGDDDDE